MCRLQNKTDSTEDRIAIPEAFALNTDRLPGKVFLLRKKLYLKAKKEKTFRFYALYDRIYRKDVLAAARTQVKRNGSALLGIVSLSPVYRSFLRLFFVFRTGQPLQQVVKAVDGDEFTGLFRG